MSSEYARAVEHLLEHPRQKRKAWAKFAQHESGCLFRFCTPSGRAEPPPVPCVRLGCPLMVSSGKYYAWTMELTRAVCAEHLPTDPGKLREKDLRALARLQRHMDETIRTKQWRREHATLLSWPWYEDEIDDIVQ